jgi:hypothetical protein
MLSYKEYDNALAVEIVIKGFVSKKELDDTAKKLPPWPGLLLGSRGEPHGATLSPAPLYRSW